MVTDHGWIIANLIILVSTIACSNVSRYLIYTLRQPRVIEHATLSRENLSCTFQVRKRTFARNLHGFNRKNPWKSQKSPLFFLGNLAPGDLLAEALVVPPRPPAPRWRGDATRPCRRVCRDWWRRGTWDMIYRCYWYRYISHRILYTCVYIYIYINVCIQVCISIMCISRIMFIQMNYHIFLDVWLMICNMRLESSKIISRHLNRFAPSDSCSCLRWIHACVSRICWNVNNYVRLNESMVSLWFLYGFHMVFLWFAGECPDGDWSWPLDEATDHSEPVAGESWSEEIAVCRRFCATAQTLERLGWGEIGVSE